MTQLAFDTGFERMQTLAPEMVAARDRNEATTRLQLIDRLLFDCLGWQREDAALEDHEGGEYADYVLPEHRRRLVVEAKKEGTTFDVPDGLARLTKLEALFNLGGDIGKALEQAQRYAQARGTPYAAICNGHQLIAFIASRQDGIGPRSGSALVFVSPDEMVSGFADLWQALTPAACATMNLSRTLGGNPQARPPKLSENIKDYPGTARVRERHYMLATLNVLFLPDYVRDDDDEETFLLECYSPPGAFSGLAMLNRSILRARYSVALGQELRLSLDEAATKEGLNPALREEVAASSAGKDPLVLLGDVGVGKTMFLRRLLRVDAKEIASDGILLYTDLGRDAVLGDIKTYVSASFREQLLTRYEIDVDEAGFLRATYRAEVKRFEKGLYGSLAKSDEAEFRRREVEYLASLTENVEEHLRRSLMHLVTLRQQQVIVVLDNVDQRLQEDQEQVFLIAESIAKTWPCTVFVTLRPETFNASRVGGTLSGYQPRAFTIQPPRVERVIAKRLEFGAKHYRDEGRLPEWLGWTADSDDLREYLDILIKSFRRSEPLQRALVNLSGGNARRGLELMTTFVNSPHGMHHQTLKRNNGNSDYSVPPYAFLRAALLGDAEYYSPEHSRIPNLFDVSTVDAREHFLLPCLLGYLQRESGQRDAEGFVALEDIFRAFQDLGFNPEQVDFAIARSLVGDLMEALPPDAEAGDDVRSVRTTTVGVYAYGTLPGDFQYQDAVVVDTPITDHAARENIKAVRAMTPRLERADTFIGYLDRCWDASGLTELGLFDWPAHAKAVRDTMSAIEAQLE
jgi:hypothetical protein